MASKKALKDSAFLRAGIAGQERRRRIITATCQVVRKKGLAEASLRNIAAEMHATTGLVTRYFSTKEELLLAALRHISEALWTATMTAGNGLSGLALVQATLGAALPVTAESHGNWQVWAAYLGAIPAGGELAQAHHHFPDRLRQTLIQGLREAQLNHETPPELYAPQIADLLVSQVIGVGMRGVMDPMRYPAEKLLALVTPLFGHLIAFR